MYICFDLYICDYYMKSLTQKTFAIYKNHSKPYAKALALILGSLVFGVAFDTYQPFLFKTLFNLLAAGNRAAVPQMLTTIWWVFAVGAGSWAGLARFAVRAQLF